MRVSHRTSWHRSTWAIWTLLAMVCAVYGLFALAAGLSLAETAKVRALPLAFEVHAISGGIVLLTGIMQFNPALRARLTYLHRWGGRLYVIGALTSSAAAAANAAFFDVGLAAKLSFALLGLIWFGATGIAFMKILQQRIEQHREWMLRSFSLSLFFVSFSLWVPFFAQFGGVLDPAYFVAVTLSWGLNLSVAEIWIRCTRAESKQARTSCYSNHNKRHWLGS